MNEELAYLNSPDTPGRRDHINNQRRSRSAGLADEHPPSGLANGRKSAPGYALAGGAGGRPIRSDGSPDRETSPVPPKAQFGRRSSMDDDDGMLVSIYSVSFLFQLL